MLLLPSFVVSNDVGRDFSCRGTGELELDMLDTLCVRRFVLCRKRGQGCTEANGSQNLPSKEIWKFFRAEHVYHDYVQSNSLRTQKAGAAYYYLHCIRPEVN